MFLAYLADRQETVISITLSPLFSSMVKALGETDMNGKRVTELNVAGLDHMFKAVGEVLNQYALNAITLFNFSMTPIESEEEVLERAEVMDMLMDMAKSETDIAMLYAQAISDRIEEFEATSLEMPKIPPAEMLAEMMKIKGLKQGDLSHIAPQSVISEIINGKRNINLKQAKAFGEFFGLPTETFID